MMTQRRPEDDELAQLLAQLAGGGGDAAAAPSAMPPSAAGGGLSFFPPDQAGAERNRQGMMAQLAAAQADAERRRQATQQRMSSVTTGAMGAMMMSDPAMKTNVEPADTDAVLRAVERLPVSTWSYKGDGAKHVGPMAPDFRRATGTGDRDDAIHVVDGVGTSLAAIQALARRMTRLERRR